MYSVLCISVLVYILVHPAGLRGAALAPGGAQGHRALSGGGRLQADGLEQERGLHGTAPRRSRAKTVSSAITRVVQLL